MSDNKKEKIMDLNDLTSRFALEDWLRVNLKNKNKSDLYEKDEKIPKIHLQKYLSFIRNEVTRQRVIDKKDWLDKIKKIEQRISEDK